MQVVTQSPQVTVTVYSVRNAHTKQWPEHLKVSDFHICEQWHRPLWEAAFEKGTEESQALMIQMGWETRLAEEVGRSRSTLAAIAHFG